jgi:hypothetical protein
MGISEIANEINELSVSDRLSIAAEILFDDYANDLELTAFTALDGEDFILSTTNK